MKLPPHAKCVFKGQIFDVYHWDQKMFDGSIKTFEGLKRPDSVVVLATMQGKIIIGDQEQPHKGHFYSLLGGRVDPGEQPLETAQRELLEEGGFSSSDWELWKTYEPLTKIEWTVHIFIARDCIKIQEPTLECGERIIAKHVDFEEFLAIVGSEKFRGREFASEMITLRYDSTKANEFKNRIFHKPSQ